MRGALVGILVGGKLFFDLLFKMFWEEVIQLTNMFGKG